MKNLAGQLTRRIRIEQKPKGQQLNGATAKGWETFYTGQGGKKDEAIYSETESGKNIVSTGRTTWTIRYRPGINATMRLVDITDPLNEVIYAIDNITEIGRQEATSLTTKRTN